MAKKAAKEDALGELHSALTKVFQELLNQYEQEMHANTNSPGPNPAMLAVITKFLKDNGIGMDSEEIEMLTSTERRLQERRAARKAAGINLSVVPLVGNE